MNEQIVWVLLLVGLLFHRGELETSHSQIHDLLFASGEEMPASGCRAKATTIGLKHRGRVELRMRSEADKLHGCRGWYRRLQLSHTPGHLRARSGATGEDDIGDPHLAAQIGAVHHLSSLIRQGKVNDLEEHRKTLTSANRKLGS